MYDREESLCLLIASRHVKTSKNHAGHSASSDGDTVNPRQRSSMEIDCKSYCCL